MISCISIAKSNSLDNNNNNAPDQMQENMSWRLGNFGYLQQLLQDLEIRSNQAEIQDNSSREKCQIYENALTNHSVNIY